MARTTTRTVLFAMVIAVIALSTVAALPAAADADSADRSVNDTTLEPGDTAEITVTAEMDASGGDLTLTETFGGEVQSASLQGVTVDGQSVSPAFDQVDSNGVVVSLTSTGTNATVEFTYVVQATGNTGNISIDGDVESGGNKIQFATQKIVIQQDPVDTSTSLSQSSVSPGSTATLTTTVENPRSGLSVDQTFTPSILDATVASVTTNGNQANPVVDTAESNGSVVTLTGLSLSDTVEIEIDLTVPQSASTGTTVDIDGNATSGSFDVDLSDQSLTVSSSGSGLVAQYDDNGDGDISLAELGDAVTDYSRGNIGISELGTVATAYSQS